MPTADVNGVHLFYELSGTGDIPLVLVHGSWSSHHTWDRVAPRLAESFRVLTYDRRGHSESERPPERGSISEDVADLAGLIAHLALAPTWVAGSSYGANVTLRLAGERADLLRGIIAHEPAPLFSLLADERGGPEVIEEVNRGERAAAERSWRPRRGRGVVHRQRRPRARLLGAAATPAPTDDDRERTHVPRRVQ